MSDVKRFYMLIRSGVAEMVPTKDADWVRSSDYDALAARHRAAIDALLGFKWRDTPEGPCFCVLFKEQGAKHTSGCRKASAVLKEKPRQRKRRSVKRLKQLGATGILGSSTLLY